MRIATTTTIAIETVAVAREVIVAVAGLVARAFTLPMDAHLPGSSDSSPKGKSKPSNKRRSSLNYLLRAQLLMAQCRQEQGQYCEGQWRLWQGSWQGIG